MRYFVYVLAAAILAGCSTPPPAPKQTNVSNRKGYSLGRPEGWDEMILYQGTDLTYLSPWETENDAFREKINVLIEMLPPMVTVDQYYKMNVDYMKKMHPRFRAEKEGAVELGGAAGYYVKYDYLGRDGHMSNEAYLFENDGTVYIVTCVATDESFPRYKPAFDTVVGTFRLTGVK